MVWSKEQIALLQELWSTGLSASQIADKLGPPCSRNAVLGKVHRLGLGAHPAPSQASRPEAPASAGQGKTPPATEAVQTPGSALGGKARTVKLLDLSEKICKWPIGHPDEPDFHFCGEPAQAGFPYCSAHCHSAYQPVMPRRERRLPPRSPPSRTRTTD